MHLRPHPSRSEEGASFIVLTLAMVVLFGFAALGVDAAAAWAQRRQNQGAVDTAAIAGALQTSGKNSAAAAQAAAESEVIRITFESMNPNMAFGTWQQLWHRTSATPCSDAAAAAAGFTVVGPKSDCVTWTPNGQRMRVKLPQIVMDTAFAGVIGADTISTTAVAEVETQITRSSLVLPFGITATAANTQTELCIKAGANPQNVPPCDGPSLGNFGFIDITQFGNFTYGTTTDCGGTDNSRIARQIAQGVDHDLGESFSFAPPVYSDIDACNTGNFDAKPWTLREAETGNRVGVLQTGLVDGIFGLPGLLTNTTNPIVLNGDNVDDTPLWDFLIVNAAAPPECSPVGPTPVDTKVEMLACLDAYRTAGSTEQIFDDTIQGETRWAWAPILSEAAFPPGSSDPVNIYAFQNVWIQTTLWKCNANSCDAIHDPGEPLNGMVNGADQVEAFTALQIPLDALSAELAAQGPGKAGNTTYILIN